MRIALIIIFNSFVIIGISGQVSTDTSSLLIVTGEKLNELRAIDYNPIVNAFPRKIERLKRDNIAVSDDVQLLLKYANKSKKERNRYNAYRYTIKALALHYKEFEIENYEVAAALRIMPKQGISDLKDTVVIKIEPIFNLGKPLVGDYKAQFTIRDGSYASINKLQFKINEIKDYEFKIPVNLNASGEYYIGYELITPQKLSMLEAPYTFLAAQGLNEYILKLNNTDMHFTDDKDIQVKAIKETLQYISNCFNKEQNGYEGYARNFPAIGRMQFLWDNRNFRQPYMGKVNFPFDINVIQDYLTCLENKSSLHRLKGDYKQAILSSDNSSAYYRIYIPEKYKPYKKHPLVAVFPMGMEVDNFFNKQAYLKQKANELNYILICVGNVTSEEDNRDVQLLQAINRIKKIYSIDSDKLFLTGGGNSGDLVWKVGCSKHSYFNAIAPISGSALWLSEDKINKNDKLHISAYVGSNEHDDIYKKVIETKHIAEDLFENYKYIEINDADHVSIWNAALPEIMNDFEVLMKQ